MVRTHLISGRFPSCRESKNFVGFFFIIPSPVNLVNVPSSTVPRLHHPFYPYPSTPVRPPPFSTTPSPIYQSPYHTYYMTPAAPPMSYYPAVPAYTHPPTPLATLANSRVTLAQTSQPTSSFEFRNYNPESNEFSRS